MDWYNNNYNMESIGTTDFRLFSDRDLSEWTPFLIHNQYPVKGDQIACEWDAMGNPTKWTVKSNMEDPNKKASNADSDSTLPSTPFAPQISKSPESVLGKKRTKRANSKKPPKRKYKQRSEESKNQIRRTYDELKLQNPDLKYTQLIHRLSVIYNENYNNIKLWLEKRTPDQRKKNQGKAA